MNPGRMNISHWHSRFHAPRALPSALLDDWHARLTDLDETALTQGLVGSDEWLLIRRLPLQASWRLEGDDVADGWFVALRRALKQALDDPRHPDVARYVSRRHAWCDLFYRTALGDCDRVWAWARMDLLPDGQTHDPETVLRHAVERLAREPELIWPVLCRLLAAESERAAFTALLRALPEAGWRHLLQQVPQVAPYLALPDAPAGRQPTPHPWPRQATGDLAGIEALLRWIGRQPWLAERHVGVVAPLLAALTWPAFGMRGADLVEGLARARDYCRAAPAKSHDAAAPARRPGVALASVVEMRTPPAGVEEALLPPLIELPDAPQDLRSEFAGALFWLGRIEASGVLAWLEEMEPMPAAARPQFLGHLADALGVAADDPVRRVFVGDYQGGESDPRLAERARQLAEVWETWLGQAAPDLPEPRLAWVCRRPGRLHLEPGWVELTLPLDSVDTRIRRLGLDLDPGWLAWLGCVVRIRYED
jgi:hypothetical protein